MRPAIRNFDRVIGGWVARLPFWVRPPMQLFTLIGQPPITVGIAATVLGYGWALNKPFYIAAGATAIATIAVSGLLKMFLRRARPVNDYVSQMLFQTFSFPSGHAAGALISFGLAAIVIGYRWPELAVVVWTGALLMTFFISLSRIYLGAHYASDIIGGWIVGCIGLVAILLIER